MISIISDPYSSLVSINSFKENKLILRNIRNMINHHGSIDIFWTKAYVENPTNEGADALAKIATKMDYVDIDLHLTNKYIKKDKK